jgi:hypothetical protein
MLINPERNERASLFSDKWLLLFSKYLKRALFCSFHTFMLLNSIICKVVFTLAKLCHKNARDNDCGFTCLSFLGWLGINRIISIDVVSPEEAKESEAAVAVPCVFVTPLCQCVNAP